MMEKKSLFLEMKGLAERQREAVVEERMDLYFDLSADREALKRRISAHETPSHGSSVDPGEGRPPSPVDEVARIIQSIQEIDRQIGAFVTEKKSALLQEIRGLRKGRRALRGYGGVSAKNPRFVDKKG
ncbi:MAG: flagellar protein FliT [Desulfatiglandales bacterium]